MQFRWAIGLLLLESAITQTAGQDGEKDTLRVVSVLAPPFLTKSGDTYEGYVVDLAHALENFIGLNITVQESSDGKYGKSSSDGVWDGMIGDIVRSRADAAIGPLTITSTRERVVDFTKPFLMTGITMVGLKRPLIPYDEVTGDTVLLFLRPFRPEVWAIIVVSFIATAVLVGIIERLIGGRNISPQSDICLGFWWTAQAFTLQGFFRGPRSIGARALLVFWFIFSVLTISLYVASLVNFLGGEVDILENLSGGRRPKFITRPNPVQTFDKLSRQSNVKYSVVQNGPTSEFFRTSMHHVYQNIWQTMTNINPIGIDSIEEGLERVRTSKGKFIFLCESKLVEYYVNREPCDLELIGSLISSAGYGVATPIGSKYREIINLAILELREMGTLADLQQRWFQPACKTVGKTLVLDNDVGLMLGRAIDTRQFGGVVVSLLLGMVIAGIVAGVEYVKKSPAKKTTSPEETQLEEDIHRGNNV